MGKVKIGYSTSDNTPGKKNSNSQLPTFSSDYGVLGKTLAPQGEEDGFWVRGTTSQNYIIVPRDKNGDKMDFFSGGKPFKIHARIYTSNYGDTPTSSNTNTLFGSNRTFYSYPSMDTHRSYFWFGMQTPSHGSGWGASIELLPQEGESYLIDNNKVYSFEYGWDGEEMFINLYDNKGVLINSARGTQTEGYTPMGISTYETPYFGGLEGSSSHFMKENRLDLSDTYVEINGEIVWGNKR